MNRVITRRRLTKNALTLLSVVSVAKLSTVFADAPALDPADPTAKALGYVTQSPKPDSKCGTCVQFQGTQQTRQVLAPFFLARASAHQDGV